METLKRLKDKLIGKSVYTPIQARIFHQICFVVIPATLLGILANFFTMIPHLSVILLAVLLLTVALYYNSRKLRNYKTSCVLFLVMMNSILIINYFINSGIQGPSLTVFILSMIFSLAVMPSKQYPYWLGLNLLLVMALLGIEYLHPTSIRYTYPSRSDVFLDISFTYVAAALCISIIVNILIKGYRKEKNLASAASTQLLLENESKTKLLSILSHDLKSPLNSIQGFLEILISEDIEKAEEIMIKQELLKEVKITQTMLFNLLNWTKSQMEGIKANLSAYNLADAISEIVEIQAAYATKKGIEFVNQINPEATLVCDLEMLRLVVRNLANNAIKFTRAGGVVTIATRTTAQELVISISDTGVGIPQNEQDQLFSLSSETTYGTNHEKGVGLGLKLCKEFTELQGGRISYHSVMGQGSVFELHFNQMDAPSAIDN